MTNKQKWRYKTPVILQMEVVECGAAALASVMAFYGKHISLEEIRVQAGVSRDGCSASNLYKSAIHYGFDCEAFSITMASLNEIELPCIIHWGFNHFVVLEKVTAKEMHINDPASGHRIIQKDEFEKKFTGVVLTLTPSKDFHKEGVPPNVLKALVRRLSGTKSAIVYLFLIGLLLIIPGLLMPIFTKIFIDEVLIHQLHSWFFPLAIGMVMTAFARGFFSWLESFVLLRISTKISITTTGKFLWHILHLPMRFFEQRRAGDITYRVSLNDEVADLIASDFANSLLSIVMLVFYFLLMCYYSWILAVITLFIAMLNFTVIKITAKHRANLSLCAVNEQGKFMGSSANGLARIETLKASGREDEFFSKWAGQLANLVRATQRIEILDLIVSNISIILSSINTMIILCLGAYFIMLGQLSVGMLVAIQSLAASFLLPLANLTNFVSSLQELSGNMMRLDDVQNHKEAFIFSAVPETPESTEVNQKLTGAVELQNISFGYNVLEEPLIKNFNLYVKPGQRIAIVGSSGCGKSTVSKLLLQLYEPWQGKILFDGQEAKYIDRDLFSNSVAMVEQSIFLFEGTVKDNVTLWNPYIAEHDVVEAMKDMQIHDEVCQREKGLHCYMSEGGSNFSGGQRQRLEMARALAINPTILILDEATSALDPVTEEKVDSQIRKRGCTTIIIAQRLSTIIDCDEIIVIDKGEIKQRGTHKELVNEKGLYEKLIMSGHRET